MKERLCPDKSGDYKNLEKERVLYEIMWRTIIG